MRARGLLLFSFAFSSVLSSAEILVPSKPAETKTVRVSRPADSDTTSPEHDLQKRDIETGKKDPLAGPSLNDRNLLFEEGDLVKRNRMGFTGMRGKKEMDPTCCSVTTGKRVLRNYKELFGGKRAPLAFHGMRGKKSGDYEVDWLEPEYLSNGELEYPELIPGRRNEDVYEEEPTINKRSPYSFQGMRGKKTNAYDLKRTMGFLGMRGKKALEVWNPDAYKRAPQSAFFGMKGKKAQSGFFGMRGKKSSFTPSLEFQGIPESIGNDYFSYLENPKEDASPVRLRRGSSWLYDDKKAKNVFFGVKGKKSTDESSLADFPPSADE